GRSATSPTLRSVKRLSESSGPTLVNTSNVVLKTMRVAHSKLALSEVEWARFWLEWDLEMVESASQAGKFSNFPNNQSRIVWATAQKILLPAPNHQLNMILRASSSGSFAMWHSLSQTIVLFDSGSVPSHFRPGTLGLTVAANAAQDEAIFFASACASGVLPVPCSQRFVLSKQN